MKKILLPLLLLFSHNSFSQINLIIQSSNEKCSSVFSNARDFNFGESAFQADRDRNSGSNTYYVVRSFLQFDLSSIPTGSKLNWARLTLYGLSPFIAGANTALLRRITSTWDQNTVTWNTQPTTALRGTIRLQENRGGEPDIYKNIDVWTLVQTMIDSPSTSFGFELKLDTEENEHKFGDVTFYSPGFGKPRYNPKLVLEYTSPGMNPSVTSISLDASGSTTGLNIYPNPCHDYFNCSVKSSDLTHENLRVIDMLGRTIYNQTVVSLNQQIKVTFPAGSSGTYFVILQNNSGPVMYQQLQVN